MTRRKALFLSGIVCWSVAASARTQAIPLAQALIEARSNLTLRNGQFAGDGAPALMEAIAQAHYVALGEDHLTREIPQFAAALCDVMAPNGLEAMAVETSPQVAQLVAPKLASGAAPNALTALMHQYPDSVAFLNMSDEVNLAAHCAREVGPTFRFWGLDQEFVGAAGWLLDLIKQRHLTHEAGAAITALRAEERRDEQEAERTGNPTKLFFFQASDRELAETATLLKIGSDQTASALFEELVVSHSIYASHHASRDQSNQARALLLKQTLLHNLQSLSDAGQHGKLLLKLGESHLYRGLNPLHQRDLGNFVAELADGQREGSLHIAVLGVKGVHRLYGGYGRKTRLEPFALSQDDDYAWLQPAIAKLLPSGWTEIDLRRLRFRDVLGLTPAWDRLIYGYDFLVLIPKLTPADPL